MAINSKIESDLLDIQKELTELNKIRTIDVKIVEEVISLTKDIITTYKEANTNAKRAYLSFFFKKILIENKKVVDTQYQPVIDVLNKAKLGILTTNGLPLKDLFCNHKLEFEITLSDIKILSEGLGFKTSYFQT